MQVTQLWAMTSYYMGTLPLRAGWSRYLKLTGQAPVCVLFYHRVADSHPEAELAETRAKARGLLRALGSET